MRRIAGLITASIWELMEGHYIVSTVLVSAFVCDELMRHTSSFDVLYHYSQAQITSRYVFAISCSCLQKSLPQIRQFKIANILRAFITAKSRIDIQLFIRPKPHLFQTIPLLLNVSLSWFAYFMIPWTCILCKSLPEINQVSWRILNALGI